MSAGKVSKKTPGTDNRVLRVCEILNRHVEKPFTIVGDDPRVDILLVAGKTTYARSLKGKLTRVIGGIKIPYLGFNDLILSKTTGRAQDLADLETLGVKKK